MFSIMFSNDQNAMCTLHYTIDTKLRIKQDYET